MSADPSTAQAVIDHAGVSVADLERSHAFYADVLGFTNVDHEFEFAEHQLRGRVLRNATGARIELFCRAGSTATGPHHHLDSTRTQGWFQLALRVPDVETSFAAAVEAGADVSMAPKLAPNGRAKIAFLRDPDGNLIELLQP